MSLPYGTYGRIAPRSGLAVSGIDVGAGVIDLDYTGEVKVLVINTNNTPYNIDIGDRIAQLIVEKIATPVIIQVEALDNTARGSMGFGSTGMA
jgi:dUTP pyrophosphatase